MDEKQKEIKTKSASGIWDWIFCLLFASAVILVVISLFGNSIWYALTGKPDPNDSRTDPGPGMTGGIMGNPILDKDIRERNVPDGSSSWE